MSRQTGFTLVEVMVALLIASLGLAAVITIAANAIDNASVFRDRAMALYIGLNVITEMRLQDEMPDLRETDDDIEFADQDWHWSARVTETGVESLRRIEVDVTLAGSPDDIIRTVTGFVGDPRRSNASNTLWQGQTGEIR